MYKILSISGGGVRGIIPALVLNEIARKTGKKIHETFDMVAGTSTGGIISLLLATPNNIGTNAYSTFDIVDFYMGNKCKKIMDTFLFPFLHDYKHPSKNIDSVLNEVFRNTKMRKSLMRTLICSYDTEKRRPIFFDNVNEKYKDLKMSDVARATSAAPTYFEPHNFNGYTCIDGGVYANNPSTCAYVEAKKITNDDIMIVSLGTGISNTPMHYNDIRDFNVLQWIKPLLDCTFDGVADTTDYHMKSLLPNDSFFKLQVDLPKELSKMDDASYHNMHGLFDLANEHIYGAWKNDIDKICEILMK